MTKYSAGRHIFPFCYRFIIKISISSSITIIDLNISSAYPPPKNSSVIICSLQTSSITLTTLPHSNAIPCSLDQNLTKSLASCSTIPFNCLRLHISTPDHLCWRSILIIPQVFMVHEYLTQNRQLVSLAFDERTRNELTPGQTQPDIAGVNYRGGTAPVATMK